jgi:hypothetical protein
MPYYLTVEQDLERARALLAKSGTIFGADVHVAYKLLESFVAELDARGRIIEVYERQLAAHDTAIRYQRRDDEP